MVPGYIYVSSLGVILLDIVPDEPLASFDVSFGGYTLNNSLHIDVEIPKASKSNLKKNRNQYLIPKIVVMLWPKGYNVGDTPKSSNSRKMFIETAKSPNS